MERDNIPVDVAVYRVKDGQAAPYYEGEDPVALPYEVQPLPATSSPLAFCASRAKSSAMPTRARRCRRLSIFIMAAGDSWHANTRRRGGIFDRVANVHQERSLCRARAPAAPVPERALL